MTKKQLLEAEARKWETALEMAKPVRHDEKSVRFVAKVMGVEYEKLVYGLKVVYG